MIAFTMKTKVEIKQDGGGWVTLLTAQRETDKPAIRLRRADIFRLKETQFVSCEVETVFFKYC
jgi:hypothetical protein